MDTLNHKAMPLALALHPAEHPAAAPSIEVVDVCNRLADQVDEQLLGRLAQLVEAVAISVRDARDHEQRSHRLLDERYGPVTR